MKSNVLTIMKKELARFLGDKRLAFSAILLPGIMIFVMYTFMGSAMENMFGGDDTPPEIAAVNMPASISAMFEASELTYEEIDNGDTAAIDEKKELISTKDYDLLMVFPENFDTLVAEYANNGTPAPNLEMYYNSADTDSSAIYSQVYALLDTYETMMSNRFDINRVEDGDDTVADLASEKDASAQIFSYLMPFLLVIFLFSGCMAVAPEAIAGEKERGTLSTLLVTPLRRSELALGKILAITIIAVMSAASSTIGTILSLPNLMGSEAMELNIFYTVSDYLLLALVILCTVLLFVSLISILSAYAKSIKEAQTYVTPLMIVVMLIGISGMFGLTFDSPLVYLVPVYNSVQCMSAIFSFELSQLSIIVTVVSNLVYCGLLVFLLTRMFNSEKIMFAR